MGGVGVSAYLSLILRRRGERSFEAGRLLTFSAFRMGAYSRWALIRGWALIRINTVCLLSKKFQFVKVASQQDIAVLDQFGSVVFT